MTTEPVNDPYKLDAFRHATSDCDLCYMDAAGLVAPFCTFQARVRVEYSTAPALTPFSLRQIPYSRARSARLASWAKAHRRASEATAKEAAA